MAAPTLSKRIAALDWADVAMSLRELGYAKTGPLLTAAECRTLVELYPIDRRFRNRVDMERYRFGCGDYAYFAAPLPRLIGSLRRLLYKRLAPLAAETERELGRPAEYPPEHHEYVKLCREAGQRRPTPLLLRYQTGGYNRLHRDLYGPIAFPLQATIALSRRGNDFAGGEFLLVENRPRQQARGEAIALDRGEMVIFFTRERPVRGARGTTRAELRHGLSRVLRGERYALGIIFHDAA